VGTNQLIKFLRIQIFTNIIYTRHICIFICLFVCLFLFNFKKGIKYEVIQYINIKKENIKHFFCKMFICKKTTKINRNNEILLSLNGIRDVECLYLDLSLIIMVLSRFIFEGCNCRLLFEIYDY